MSRKRKEDWVERGILQGRGKGLNSPWIKKKRILSVFSFLSGSAGGGAKKARGLCGGGKEGRRRAP